MRLKKIRPILTRQVAIDAAPINGCIIECGVAQGYSLRYFISKANGRQVFGFDSFNGLPEDWKMSDTWTWPAGSFACDILVEPNADIIVGYFADTLPVWKQTHADNIALLHFDADLYSSAVTVLTELNDRIVPGTIVQMDDMFKKPHKRAGTYTYWRDGEYKAFVEWKNTNNRQVEMIARGKGGQGTFRILQ